MTLDEKRQNFEDRVQFSCQERVLRRECIDALSPRGALALAALVDAAGGEEVYCFDVSDLSWAEDVAEELAACGLISEGGGKGTLTEDGEYAIRYLNGCAA